MTKGIKYFITAFIGCLLVKIILSHFVLGHAQVNTVSVSIQKAPVEMTVYFFKHQVLCWSVLWINAGMSWVIFCFKPLTIQDKGVLVVSAMFMVLILITEAADSVGGARVEPRQWTDILPMCAIYLHQKIKLL